MEGQFEHPLARIERIVNRQILGFATVVAFLNYVRGIFEPGCKLFQVNVGGLQYPDDLKILHESCEKEDAYWKFF